MPVHQLIYSSQPFGFDEAILIGVLMDARKHNEKSGVTGALICRADVYLQLLEGPKDLVEETMARIRRDDRHVNIQMHVQETVEDRLFPKWAMHHDPATSWHWTQEEVADDALERATPAEFRQVFSHLASRTAAA